MSETAQKAPALSPNGLRHLLESAEPKAERVMVAVALSVFAVHWIVLLAGGLRQGEDLERAFLRSCIAIKTPFSVILLFEVFNLITSLLLEPSLAAGRQYKVVTLIIIRDVFKDLGEYLSSFGGFSDIVVDEALREHAIYIGSHTLAAVLLFTLTLTFYFVWRKYKTGRRAKPVALVSKLQPYFAAGTVLMFGVLVVFHILHTLPAVWEVGELKWEWLYPATAYKAVFLSLILADIVLLVAAWFGAADAEEHGDPDRHGDNIQAYGRLFRNAGLSLSRAFVILAVLHGGHDVSSVVAKLSFAVAAVVLGITAELCFAYDSFVHRLISKFNHDAKPGDAA